MRIDRSLELDLANILLEFANEDKDYRRKLLVELCDYSEFIDSEVLSEANV
jgi:uncharacterized protein (DUF927 family)